MIISSLPIGVFDSGVGGLSVLKAIGELMPRENLIYLADSRYTPYGEKSSKFIAERVEKIAEFLVKKNVKAIVVACNTATAAAIHTLREKYDIPIIGLEPAIKPAIEFSENEIVGVLATQSTLDSQKYHDLKIRYIEQAESEYQLIEKASNYFVELVEQATEINEQVSKQVAAELTPFLEAKVDSLVLGCTHYPFLTELIQKIMGARVKLFESGMPVAKELQRRIEEVVPSLGEGNIDFYSSAPEKSKLQIESLMGKPIKILPFGL